MPENPIEKNSELPNLGKTNFYQFFKEWWAGGGASLIKLNKEGLFAGATSFTNAIFKVAYTGATTVTDSLFTIQDNLDTTKKTNFQLSGITTGNTRVVTIPDANGTIAYTNNANFVTGGDAHNHSGGDGAQINHTTLANIGTNTHAQIDTHISTSAIRARVYRDSSAQGGFQTVARVQLNGETYDTGSDYDNATNFRFTADVAGYCDVYANLTVAMAANQITIIYIYKNGSEYSRRRTVAASARDDSIDIKDNIPMAINDYLEIWLSQDSGADKNVYNGANLSYATYEMKP